MIPTRVLLFASAALSCGTSPCGPPELEGESVGTFAVVGTLEENSCGQSGVAASDPLRFEVEIRNDRGEPVWRRPGWPQVVGSLGADGIYRFTTQHHAVLLEADRAQQFPGCMVAQLETVRVRLIASSPDGDAGPVEAGPVDAGPADAGPVDASSYGGLAPTPDATATGGADGGPSLRLEGRNTVELVPTPESDCRPAVASAGGPFLALPCRVEYTLGGTGRDPL